MATTCSRDLTWRAGHWTALVLGALLSITTLGCESDPEPTLSPSLPGLSADLTRFIRARCEKWAECAPDAFRGPRAVEECMALDASYYCRHAGSETLELPELEPCLAELDCPGDRDEPAAGAPAACVAITDALRAMTGRSVAGKGEPCALQAGTFCEPGLFCSVADSACGVCKELAGEGARCEFGYGTCAEGLQCQDGTCRPLRENGAACVFDYDCAGDLCARGQCFDAHTLAAASCESDQDCGSFFCDDGRCTPLRGLGEACERDGQCREACREGECATVLGCGLGFTEDPCYDDAHCLSGLVCDHFSLRCRRPLESGAACRPSERTCPRDQFCEASGPDASTGTCTPRKADGEACAWTFECVADRCLGGVCGGEPSACGEG